jgi:SAM-dependent methyltransferase
MDATQAPIPPVALATRVGPGASTDPIAAYLREGAAVRERIERLLPEDWDWSGASILDFGCGAARVLRQFLAEAEHAQFWGCDIDAPSIDWVEANLSPPLRVFRNEPKPPLPLDARSFDLVYATSVFTHISDAWSDWLLEMHRILAPRGRLIASFLGEGMWEALIDEPYREDAVGMTVRRHWTAEDAWVFHSEWWLREHWGRLFDITAIARPPRDAAGRPQVTHSYVALTRRDVALTRDELERCRPSEPRELAALQTEVRLLRQELAAIADQPAALLPSARTALRHAVVSSPLGRPAQSVRRRLRALQTAVAKRANVDAPKP